MLIDSVSQESRQDMAEMACLCSMIPKASAESFRFSWGYISIWGLKSWRCYYLHVTCLSLVVSRATFKTVARTSRLPLYVA